MYKVIAITLALAITASLGANIHEYNFARQGQRNYNQQPQTQQYHQTQQLHQTQPQQFRQTQPQQWSRSITTVNKLTRDDTAEATNSRVNVEHLQAFREYTLNLVRQRYYIDAYERTGAVSYCPFTLGHLLATVHERVLNVPAVVDIPRVLNLRTEQVPVAYSGILDSFVEDTKIQPSSYLYVSDPNVQVTPQYQRLHTVKQVVQLHQNRQASEVINTNYRTATNGVVDNLVVPQVPPFNETVAGVHSNSFFYTSRWVQRFNVVGQQPFHVTPQKVVRVNTLESVGTYPVTVNSRYSAVAVPLEGDRKHVVLVQPKVSIEEFIQNDVSDIFLTVPQKWQKQAVKIQVPEYNITMGRNFVSQINELAGSEVQCPSVVPQGVDRQVSYLHPIVQVISTVFSQEGVTVAVANGVQVDRFNSFNNNQVNKVVKTGHVHHVPTTTVVHKVKTAQEIDAEVVATQIRSNTEFIFDRPFFVYVHDSVLGAVSFTAIKTPVVVDYHNVHDVNVNARHHVVRHTDFDEESKVYRWNCGHDEATVSTTTTVVRGQQNDQVPNCKTQY